MRLLVTGGAGFIGSNFVRYWRANRTEDDVMRVMDKLTYAGTWENIDPGWNDDGIDFCTQADVTDTCDVGSNVEGFRPDVILHLAAETHVDRSIQGAAEFIQTNEAGTYNMLEAARAHGVQKFIHVSTDEVYGEVLEGSSVEADPFRPSSPYAASKAAGDLHASSSWRTHGLPVVIVRPCNVFGPYQYPEKLIPFLVARAMRDETFPLYGNGYQERAWMHVNDLCVALDLLIKYGAPGQAYNVSVGVSRPNIDIARAIQSSGRAVKSEVEQIKDRPGHDRRYAPDPRKFREQILTHEPDADFGKGYHPSQLYDTINWYFDNQDWCERRLEESKAYFERQYGEG